jgi:hypothetical protein
VQSVNGVPRYVFVWDGVGWTRAQYLADEILLPGEDGAIRLGDSMVSAPNMAAGALDAFTVNALQMYGGYIEAPVIASSDKLGSGANVLADPEFQSTVDTAWVASGHLGDAATSSTDTHTWDQTVTRNAWMDNPATTRRYRGSGVSRLLLTPAVRRTGSLLFANYGWKPANRTFTNPKIYTNPENWFSYIPVGKLADEWKASGVPALGSAVSRTTYLTNSTVAEVIDGERWNVRAKFSRVGSDAVGLVDIRVELIDAVSSSLVWHYDVSDGEKIAGEINTWFLPEAPASLRLRIRAEYTAAGGSAERRMDVGGYSRVDIDGVVSTHWIASSSDNYHSYGNLPTGAPAGNNPAGIPPENIKLRAELQVVMTSAVFAKVEPQKGWRITEEGGLELFNSLGTKTGNIDGENNFLAGRFATADSGMRWEVQGERVAFFDAAGLLVGGMRRAGDGIQIFGPISYQGDTDWITIPLLSEFEVMSGVTPRYKVSNGTLYLRGRVRRKTGADLGTAYTSVTPAGVIPDLTGIRDSAGSARSVPGSGVNGEGLVRITDNGAIQCAAQTGIAHSFLTADWLIG